jgi:putative ABC transport system substrate-binding protein
MDRRAFVVALLATYGCGQKDEPKTTEQSTKSGSLRRVGMLYFSSAADPYTKKTTAVFRQRLAEHGYVEGKNILIDARYAEANAQRLTELARELEASKVDVIVAVAVAATTAARQATSRIPIVMVHAGNPVGAGLIASLARPGGNVTGTTNLPLGGKQVELIRELVPGVAKLAILANPTNAGAASFVAAMTDASHTFNINVVVVEVTRAEDFANAFTVIRNAGPDGLVVMMEPLIGKHFAELIEFAATARLPAIYDNGETVRRGGLIAYSTVYIEHYALAANYVDKILKGAKPGDLSVQQPARFELVINLKAAKALGLTVPQSLLQRADEVIQ